MTPAPEQITAAARALANHNADVCGVNREDNWNIYGDSFVESARIALEAIATPAAVAQAVDARDEREALLADHIELNMSNYGPDDVDALNAWAIRAYAFIDRAMSAFPEGFTVKRVEGHGWIVDPPSGSRWIAHEGTPAGDLMQALTAKSDAAACAPVGWKLVPTVHEGRAGLTDKMMRWFYEAWERNGHRGDFERLNAAYNAMLNAAPPRPATEPPKLSTETVDNPVGKLTDEQREALKHLIARGSTFPAHNGRSGSSTPVDYAHLQAAAKVLSELLREAEQS